MPNVIFRTLVVALVAALAAPVALAQQGKPLRIIVPFAAGGPIDVTTRLLADRVREPLGGAPVIVENRPGAGGGIGVEAVAKAAPDGTTIGIAATAMHAVNPWLFPKLPYDALADFAPITQTVRVPNVLVMNAEAAERLRITDLKSFVAYARANPGKLNYGSGGNGSAGHLAGELFKARAKVFAVHIPYNGGAPAQLALVAGQVDYTFDNLATAAPNIRAGKLRAFAVTTAERSPLLPDAPTMADLFPGFAIDTWWGLIAPAGTPKPIVDRLNAAFVAALQAPEVRQGFEKLMAEPVASTPEAFAAFIRSEHAKYQQVVKQSGAKVD
jgi:tripartite-type tricarboxylate transporter receptor subunit TctC